MPFWGIFIIRFDYHKKQINKLCEQNLELFSRFTSLQNVCKSATSVCTRAQSRESHNGCPGHFIRILRKYTQSF